MQEVNLKDNESGIKVYVDDLPITNLIPNDLIDVFINALVVDIQDIIKSKERRKSYYIASKQNSTKKVPP